MNRTLWSTAKINLYLDVIGKDPVDSYHWLESVFQEISLADEINIQDSSQDQIVFEPSLRDQETTVHKALRLFKESFNVHDHYKIFIKKNIPMGAGLGGGSSNAAFVLQALADKYQIPTHKLFSLAAKIGSDVSFFLTGGLAHVSGKGDRIVGLNSRLEDMYFLIVYPGIHISTAWAYSLIDSYGNGSGILPFLKLSEVKFDFLKNSVYNSFQHFVLNSHVGLRAVKTKVDSIISSELVFMSGSGSSLVYVYQDLSQAEQDKKLIEAEVDFPLFLCRPVYR